MIALLRPSDEGKQFIDAHLKDYERTPEVMSFMQLQRYAERRALRPRGGRIREVQETGPRRGKGRSSPLPSTRPARNSDGRSSTIRTRRATSKRPNSSASMHPSKSTRRRNGMRPSPKPNRPTARSGPGSAGAIAGRASGSPGGWTTGRKRWKKTTYSLKSAVANCMEPK